MCPGWFNFGFPKFVTSRLNHILSWPPRSHFGATAPSSRLSKRCCGSCRRWGVSTGVAGEARRQIQKKTYTTMRLKQKETKESIHTTMRPNEKETKNPKRVNLAFCTTDKTNSPPTDQSVDYSCCRLCKKQGLPFLACFCFFFVWPHRPRRKTKGVNFFPPLTVVFANAASWTHA